MPTSPTLSIQFCGAAHTVTGSMYFLEYTLPTGKIFRFLVDAGMFQVGQDVSLFKMNSHLLFEPKHLDAVVLTHCHLDHCGRLPYLVKKGFGGRIYSTPATKELTEIVLLDAARQQDPKVKDNRYHMEELGINREDIEPGLNPDWFIPAQPELTQSLYDQEDAELTISRFKTYKYHEEFEIIDGLWIQYRDAGHILGSANVVISEKNKEGQVLRQMIFSGDLGNPHKPIIEDPEMHSDLKKLTHIVTESTYGDRVHPKLDPKSRLKEIIKTTAARKGKVLIPSFSVERAQEVIYYIAELMKDNEIPQMPIYLDSPMASKVLEVCLDHPELYDSELRQKIQEKANPLIYRQIKVLETIPESKSINGQPGPSIIIAGSGMLNGGRILKHLQHEAWKRENSLIFVGYQAEGTLGRKILDLWREQKRIEVEVDDRPLDIRAEIFVINEFSAHADQLMIKNWISEMIFNTESSEQKVTVFITHGEASAAQTLSKELQHQHPKRIDPIWPKFGEKIQIWS
ncbi:MAG: MBL fold metallo-hydrolase [Patescibacteria group bacterium]